MNFVFNWFLALLHIWLCLFSLFFVLDHPIFIRLMTGASTFALAYQQLRIRRLFFSKGDIDNPPKLLSLIQHMYGFYSFSNLSKCNKYNWIFKIPTYSLIDINHIAIHRKYLFDFRNCYLYFWEGTWGGKLVATSLGPIQ